LFAGFNNEVLGNFIGTDVSGKVDLGNRLFGVEIFNGQTNRIGALTGSTIAAIPNLISGNGANGVDISGPVANDNIVVGNFIGSDNTGEAALGNDGAGVSIDDGSSNLIGHSGEVRLGNLISGNAEGVVIEGLNGNGNEVVANVIGAAANGIDELPNTFTGIRITESSNNNLIGGVQGQDLVAPGNIIAFNGGIGIRVESGICNRILGTPSTRMGS
jgi:hypothetical protein